MCMGTALCSIFCYPVKSQLFYLQLDAVEKERAKLVKQCEEQNLALQQHPREGSLLHRSTGPTAQSDPGNEEAMACRRLVSTWTIGLEKNHL